MNSELLPCPFCGSADKHDADCYIPMLVECVESNLFLERDHENKLVEAWNTRAERTCFKVIPNEMEGYVFCSNCGAEIGEYGVPNYCHNCGAKVVQE